MVKRIYLLLTGIVLCLALSAQGVPGAAQADTIDVTGFNVQPNSFADATEGVSQAIAACRKRQGAVLLFPKGRYDFWPDKAAHVAWYMSNTSTPEENPSEIKAIGLLFAHMKGLTVEGSGSLLIFHGKMVTWALDSCTDTRLQDISVDFERPMMSEMTFKQVSNDSIVAEVHPDSRYTILNGQLVWYGEGWTLHHFFASLADPVTGTIQSASWEPFLRSKAKTIAPLTVVFKGDFSRYAFRPGEVLTVRDPARDVAGAFINHSRDITLKNVHMCFMHGQGIIAQFSENLFYDSVAIKPAEGSGRVIASSTDCLHFSGCRGLIRIEHCWFGGTHDDNINVHGTYLQIAQIISPTSLKVRFVHLRTRGIQAFFRGDSVALVHSSSLQVYGYSIVAQAKLVSDTEMLVELDKPLAVPVRPGDCLENVTWTPSLIVRHCRFGGTPTRGLLVSTRKPVLIEDNLFYRTGMYAILIAGDAASWYESGPVTDVTIRRNVFEECAYRAVPNDYIIAVKPEVARPVPGYWVHRNIRIEDNTFRVFDCPLLTARSTAGLIFEHNAILHSTFMKAQEKTAPAFRLTDCTGVRIADNRFDVRDVPEASLEGMDSKDFDIQDCRVLFDEQ